MVFALECVNSRAFSGVYEGSTAGERRSLFFFVGVLTLLWPVLGLGSTDQALSAAITAGFSIVARDFFFSRIAGLKRYVLCPCVDMFNHKSTCSSDVAYNYFQNTFELKTQGYDIGEQVYISYGRQSNDRLLQYYGFVEQDNPNDLYDFSRGVLELLLLHGDRMAVEISFPQVPSPSDRIKVIAEAIRETPVQDSKETSTTGASQGSENLTSKYFRSSGRAGLTTGGGAADLTAAPPASQYSDNEIAPSAKFDDVTVRSLRLFFASTEEWLSVVKVTGGGASSPLSLGTLGVPLSAATEARVNHALRLFAQYELQSKPTALEEDYAILASLDASSGSAEGSTERAVASSKKPKGGGRGKGGFGQKSDGEKVAAPVMDPSGKYSDEYFTAVNFRIEKKKLLVEAANSE